MKKIYMSLVLLLPFLLNAQISQEQFLKLQTELSPDKDEAWKSIPWKVSVLEAQKVATKSKKPIFIWAMDGHPLACV